MAVVTYILPDGAEINADTGRTRENVMTLARREGVPGIPGDCGGFMACATCHVYIAPEWREAVGPPASEEEDEMLDLAGERRPESRLGCQIWLDKHLDGLRLRPANA
ncbi:2Fe-2S iron-sulfur cluster-binding protein [Stakelama tenebrarum]|uniref:2Fe-2S iron-sulfur cluster binding domain-containing protein n=1 Tax=Stakelama tenebrarum TaxID=2711215 RepID=A0A6G6Y734_9SPHN|nr:2Fe-2S iron-sulfur cluster-binding protein [Sphingosinithalassobacter tenebrarum]QIG80752.1 2Fe-2S iron-sulfur cluster binding domain-containing protein [Sphingosinithalassobacter tenebrarum]